MSTPAKPWANMSPQEKNEAVAKARADGLSHGQIAKLYGVSTGSIASVNNRLLNGPRDRAKTAKPRPDTKWASMSPEEKRAAVKVRFLAGGTYLDIMQDLGAPDRGSIAVTISRLRQLGELPPAGPRGSRAAKPLEQEPTPAPPKPTSVSSMVDDWLAKNGGARKFERGASNDIISLSRYVERHGLEITFTQRGTTPYTVAGLKGRPKKFTRSGLFEFVDELRVADGLQPFLPPKDIRNGSHP